MPPNQRAPRRTRSMTTNSRPEPRRLDTVVVELTALTRSQARALILAGKVRVDGEPASKPGAHVPLGANVHVDEPPKYVSRGGDKLEGALRAFAIDPAGLDVGRGQIAWKLRSEPRVTVVERTNFRTLPDDAYPEGFDLIVIDTSFISLRTIVVRAAGYLRAGGAIIALVKPQFEAGRERLGGGGVVRDPAVHAEILREVRDGVRVAGVRVVAAALSPLRGPAGNVEFFYLLRRDGDEVGDAVLDALVREAHAA